MTTPNTVEELQQALKGAAVIADAAGQEIRTLKDRNAALESKCRLYEASLDKADREVDGLKRDAERYRWLRDEAVPQLCVVLSASGPLYDQNLDAAIDAALSQSKGEPK